MADRRLKAVATAEHYTQGNIAGLDDAATRRLVASTVLTESNGGDLAVVNSLGYVGRYQAGAAWLADAGYINMDKYREAHASMSRRDWEQGGGQLRFMQNAANWNNGLSFEQYVGSADLQDRAFKTNCDSAYRQAIRNGVLNEADSPEHVAGFLKARHIAGYNGARDVVTGARVRRDANGTSNYDYYHDITRNRDGLDQLMDYQRSGRSESAVRHAETEAPDRQPPASSVLKQGAEGPQVRELQTQLAALGYVGRDGKPITPDGDFGPNTKHAVQAFQQAHGLDVDGKAGRNTLAELATAKTDPLITEASHPNHGLYTAIGQQLPAGTKPEAVANITLQAMENGITKPADLQGVLVRGSDVFVRGATPGFNARVDLDAPTADLQAMSTHMGKQAQHQAHTAQRGQEPVLQ